MESFHWNKQFETGLQDIDEQHRCLVSLINRFGAELSRSDDDLLHTLNELADYADYHFKGEESLMESEGVDQQHVSPHREAHEEFLSEVVRMREDLRQGNSAVAESLLKFLTQWLAYHILGTDQVLARQIAAMRAGHSPAEAYTQCEGFSEGAMETMLDALNGLLHHLSERNQQLAEFNQSLETKVAERTGELSQANRKLMETIQKLEIEKEESLRLSRELGIANRRLEDMALSDVLTGLPNRRHAIDCLYREWGASLQRHAPLACMMIDADGFKQINDTYGHDAGDAVLKALARELRHSVRTDDLVCRLGGDEFLIICPRTSLDGALRVAESTRRVVAALRVPAGAGEWRGSISIGVAEYREEMKTPEDLIKAADEGVYAAKRNGRNCVASVLGTETDGDTH